MFVSFEQEIIYVWLSKAKEKKEDIRLDILSSRNALFTQEDIISQGTVCMMVTAVKRLIHSHNNLYRIRNSPDRGRNTGVI